MKALPKVDWRSVSPKTTLLQRLRLIWRSPETILEVDEIYADALQDLDKDARELSDDAKNGPTERDFEKLGSDVEDLHEELGKVADQIQDVENSLEHHIDEDYDLHFDDEFPKEKLIERLEQLEKVMDILHSDWRLTVALKD